MIKLYSKINCGLAPNVKKSKEEGKDQEILNRYNQAPLLALDTNEKVTTSQLDIRNESKEASPFQAGDHKATTNRRA